MCVDPVVAESLEQLLRSVFASALGIFVRTAETPKLYFLYIDHEFVLLGVAYIKLVGHCLSFAAKTVRYSKIDINPLQKRVEDLATEAKALAKHATGLAKQAKELAKQVRELVKQARELDKREVSRLRKSAEVEERQAEVEKQQAEVAPQLTELLRCAVAGMLDDQAQLVQGSLRELATILASEIGEGGRPTEIQAKDTGILPDKILRTDFPQAGSGEWKHMPAGRPIDGETSARNLYRLVPPLPPGPKQHPAPVAQPTEAPRPLAFIKLVPAGSWGDQKLCLPEATCLREWMIFDMNYVLMGYPDYGKTLYDAPPSPELILPAAHQILVQITKLTELLICHNDLRLPNVAWQPGRPETITLIDYDRSTNLGAPYSVHYSSVEVPQGLVVLYQTSLLLRRLGKGRAQANPTDDHPNPEITATCNFLISGVDLPWPPKQAVSAVWQISAITARLRHERDRLAALLGPKAASTPSRGVLPTTTFHISCSASSPF
ncbi:hypothetical protein PAPYR_9289 [Paratrimastix pyriformis]|uniref:Aminoglycoside phosphotransferase domain-containing protein n=1 Tax=Paratrimastix pyriformis TaxID=342808 RepID=A0ABQ8UE96_9EUKA|nr:hypothetical protein PAPYR_9289 [Paratrimastix pyriformis]